MYKLTYVYSRYNAEDGVDDLATGQTKEDCIQALREHMRNRAQHIMRNSSGIPAMFVSLAASMLAEADTMPIEVRDNGEVIIDNVPNEMDYYQIK